MSLLSVVGTIVLVGFLLMIGIAIPRYSCERISAIEVVLIFITSIASAVMIVLVQSGHRF